MLLCLFLKRVKDSDIVEIVNKSLTLNVLNFYLNSN